MCIRDSCDLDLPFLAQNRDGTFQVLWVGTGRRLERTKSTRLELPCRDCSILGLHAMQKTARYCIHRRYRATKPLHEVHVVDSLVGDTATILRPRAPPWGLVVVVLRPMPA